MIKKYTQLTEEERLKAYKYWLEDNQSSIIESVFTRLIQIPDVEIENLVFEKTNKKIKFNGFELINGEIIGQAKKASYDSWQVIYTLIANEMEKEKSFDSFEIWASNRNFDRGGNVCAGDRSDNRILPERDPDIIFKKFVDVFTDLPGSEYRWQGPFSGQQFQEEHLRDWVNQAVAEKKKLVIDFGGVCGLPFTFIRGAFGHLQYDVFAAKGIHLSDIIEVKNSMIDKESYNKELQEEVDEFIGIGWEQYQEGCTPEDVHLPQYLRTINP